MPGRSVVAIGRLLISSVSAASPSAHLLRDLQRTPAAAGLCAVRLHLSIPPGESRPWLRALFRQPLEPLEAAGRVRSYALADTDHVVLCDDLSLDLIEDVVCRLNQMLSPPQAEPLPVKTVDASWFDLTIADQRAAVAGLAAAAAAAARVEGGPRPMTAGDLEALADLVTADRVRPLLRRQRALLLRSAEEISPLFTEIAVAPGALQQAIAPDIDLQARPALLRCLGERLDRALLGALTGMRGTGPPLPAAAPLSFALGLASLALPEFAAFIADRAALGDAPAQVLIQIGLDDALDDFAAFIEARDWLRQQGFGIFLHGVSPATLELLDPSAFAADFIKVRFPPSRSIQPQMGRLAAAVRGIGREHLIFADIDSEETVMEALRLGVRQFQGRFIDTLVTAMLAKGWL